MHIFLAIPVCGKLLFLHFYFSIKPYSSCLQNFVWDLSLITTEFSLLYLKILTSET